MTNMNKLSITAFLLMATGFLAGWTLRAESTPRILQFDSPVIDVDTIRYDAGPVTVRFECTSIADKDVQILDVHAQCGCTEAVFSGEIIPPGGKGYVDVTLDPKNLFAEQDRHLTVIATNGDYKKFNTITVRGYVDRGVTEEEIRYPFLLDPGLRAEVGTVGMRLYERGESSIKEFTVYNSADTALALGWIRKSPAVRAEIPDTLGAGEKCRIRVTVNTLPVKAGRYEESLWLTVGTDTVRMPLKGAVKETCGPQGNTVLIPEPKEIYYGQQYFLLGPFPEISVSDSMLIPAAEYLDDAIATNDWLWKGSAGWSKAADNIKVFNGERPEKTDVTFSLVKGMGPEEYSLDILEDGITVSSGTCQGAIHAVSTLRQFMWESGHRLPAASVQDSPRYPWRGAMLDVARHFFDVDEIKMLLDRMALYKFNRLHLHLTDDQGWRVEIPSLPRLTSEGAWGSLNSKDSLCLRLADGLKDDKFMLPEDKMKDGMPGGYYTSEDIRTIVRYAAARGIEIIPEVDFPGHSLAVLKAYPELSCDGKGGAWGPVFTTPLCLGNNRTTDFCKEVFSEIFRLFPSEYIHIGGDEVDPSAWGKCPECRRLMASLGISSPKDLQAHFTRDMEKFCMDNGKTIIGWDEVSGDGLSSESMVMWWRNWVPQTLRASIAQGHEVVVSSSEYYYLSSEQDRNSLHKTYSYDPYEAGGNSPLVIGVQGHLWSEQAPTLESVGERIFPRLMAISETGWTAPGQKDYGHFEQRLPLHLKDLDKTGWKYRFSDVSGVFDSNVFTDAVTVDLDIPERATLHYTLDGSIPVLASPVYDGPLTVREDCTMKMRCYNSRGVAGELKTAVFRKTGYMPAAEVTGKTSDGLKVRWHDYKGETCREIESAPLKKTMVCSEIGIPAGVSGNIGLIFDGYIDIPEDGIYTFYTYSDDGSILEIDGVTVIDNDGGHPREEKTGQAALEAGLHRLSIRYFDSNGGIFEAGFTDRAGRHTPIPAAMLRH